MDFEKKLFGHLDDGREVYEITFSDELGNTACVISYGAILKNLFIRDNTGNFRDVVLGCDTLEEYVAQTARLGSTMGRSTSRTAKARFQINGTEYVLSENRNGFHMHGGFEGFDKKLWDCDIEDDRVTFTYLSPDGEEGYPGNLTAKVSYSFDGSGILLIEYDCVSDKDTLINLTNHSYFNLDGHESGDILNHQLKIKSLTVAKIGADTVPEGEFIDVSGTPLDFSDYHAIGERIGCSYEPLVISGGYDANYFFEEYGMKSMADLFSDASGIELEVYSDLCDLGLYTANSLPDMPGKGGAHYGKFGGVCLETQFVPNSVNFPDFSQKPVFAAGQRYNFKTWYCFTLRN